MQPAHAGYQGIALPTQPTFPPDTEMFEVDYAETAEQIPTESLTEEELFKIYEQMSALLEEINRGGRDVQIADKRKIHSELRQKITIPTAQAHLQARFGMQGSTIEEFEMAINEGANVNLPTFLDEFPLHTACRRDNLDLMNLFLRRGANPHLKQGSDQTTLVHIAAKYGSYETLEKVVSCGVSVNGKTSTGVKAISLCFEGSNATTEELKKMTLLLNAGTEMGKIEIENLISRARSYKPRKEFGNDPTYALFIEAALSNVKDWSQYQGWNVCHFLAYFNCSDKFSQYPVEFLSTPALDHKTPFEQALGNEFFICAYAMLERGLVPSVASLSNRDLLQCPLTKILFDVYGIPMRAGVYGVPREANERKALLLRKIDAELVKLNKCPKDSEYWIYEQLIINNFNTLKNVIIAQTP